MLLSIRLQSKPNDPIAWIFNPLMDSPAADLLFAEDAVDDTEFAAADFLVTVFGVEMLGADEDNGGVQVQHGVAEAVRFSGGLQFRRVRLSQ
jgi:hypothetical protein